MIYAVGDIHGQLAQLTHVLHLIEADGGPDAQIVFLGDYTDRGPHSRAVIDRLIQGQDQGRPWTCLFGNHDRMFLRFVTQGRIDDPQIRSGKSWLHPALGGGTTLASYFDLAPYLDGEPAGKVLALIGTAPETAPALNALITATQRAVPDNHVAFLKSCPTSHHVDDLFFCHAGVRPGVALSDQGEEDLIWIREPFLSSTADHGALIVHGHTPIERAVHGGNRINLDTGAGYGRPLTAAVFDNGAVFHLTDQGRVRLAP